MTRPESGNPRGHRLGCITAARRAERMDDLHSIRQHSLQPKYLKTHKVIPTQALATATLSSSSEERAG